MSKYYAVKIGKIPGIYRNWSKCKEQVDGFSGALHKSFKTEKEAQNFMNPVISKKPDNKKKIDIYTDGSHQPSIKFLGFGAYCKFKGKEYGLSVTCDKKYLATYNIKEKNCSNPTAEFLGFAEVLQYFVGISGYSIHFYIDYNGVERWMNGEWECKEIYIKKIKNICDSLIDQIDCSIIFHHVEGHSGNEGNDKADLLAKSLEESSNFDELISILQIN